MPRISEDTFVGYGFRVERAQVPKSHNGQPLYDSRGEPQMLNITRLVFVDTESRSHSFIIPIEDEPLHILRMELLKEMSEEQKQEVLRELTGLIVPAINGQQT